VLVQQPEAQESALIEAAIAALTRRLSAQRPTHGLANSEQVKQLVYLHLAHREREHFAVAFLDAQLRLIAFEELFAGTLTATAVYPREIARRALACNANSVILAHNHPSGNLTPSHADEVLTHDVTKALGSLSVQVVDHVIVSPEGATSFAERGLL
jgi:DNA repair protein RadC